MKDAIKAAMGGAVMVLAFFMALPILIRLMDAWWTFVMGVWK